MKWLLYDSLLPYISVEEVKLDHIIFHPEYLGGKENKKKGSEKMKNEKINEQKNKQDDLAAIGIGAMIVFIALILVAAVASAVIIQTGEKLQQNAQAAGEGTKDSMASKVTIISIVISAANELYITYELAPGSDAITQADIDVSILCERAGSGQDFYSTFTAATNLDGSGDDDPAESGNVYTVALPIGATDCQPAANSNDILMIQAGAAGTTYETLTYGGSVSAGSVVV